MTSIEAACGLSPLTVVSPLRPWGPSYRVRVDAWLQRSDLETNYVGPTHPYRARDSKRFTLGDFMYETAVRAQSLVTHRRVLIQKEASRLGVGALEARLIRRADVSIFDLDDAVFFPESSSVPAILGSRPARAEVLLKSVDRVIAGNDYLAAVASKYCNDVRVIPTCIDLSEYDYIPAAKVEEDRPLVLGWLGSASTERYLAPLYPVLARLQQEHSIVVRVIGADGPGNEVRKGCRIELRPWSLESQARELHSFDIGLAPLAASDWERGKCGYKLLQYAAAGIAPVGDPVGVSAKILASCGAPAPASPEDWYAALSWLIGSPNDRKSIGAQARHFVDTDYSFTRWHAEWLAAVS